ncbi:hypothetical protein ACJJTC_002351 [Scirpophaga incertulas]
MNDSVNHQYQSPNIIETIEEPTNQPPSPTTPGPPASAVNAPSQAGAAAGNIISIQQRRRQRRQSRITVGEARERIVSASERRAEAEAANSASLQQALTGGGPSTEQPLTEIERNFLSILGEDYGSGLPGVQVRPAVTEEIQSRHETDRLSQPSTSTDGNPVYLDISFDDSDHQYQSPNIIETIEEPTNQPPSPTTPGPPASAVNAPSQTGAAAGNIISIQQRRRQRRQSRITVGEARERIVSASERRAEAEAANSASLQQALTISNEMVAVLRRIEIK